MIIKISCCLLMAGLLACQPPEPPRQLTPAFYHWKTTYNLTSTENAMRQQLGIRKLYLRFFDVDWNPDNRQPVPKAVVRFAQPTGGLVIVPVVFITNRTLLNVPMSGVSELAKQLADKIRGLARQERISFREVQLDCDWSPGSRTRYFSLLRAVHQQLGVPLSATIRLHQIKYAGQIGVPPVERGMLMCYNVADWKNPVTRNSILDLAVADRYLGFLDRYPLPLDVVLPLFHWTLVYRNDRFFTILNNMDRATLIQRPFLKMQSDTNRFVVRQDTTVFGFQLRRGDLFRAESCSINDLMRLKRRLLDRIHNRNLTFALYHLDRSTIAPYPHGTLKTLLRPGS